MATRDWAETLSDFLSSDFERSQRAASAYSGVIAGALREMGAPRDSRDDLVAEALLRLSQHGPHLREPAASGVWIRRVTQNLYLDSVGRATLSLDPIDVEHVLSPEPPIDVQVITAQVHAALTQGISELQRRYRDVIQVCYFGDMTIHEAAAALRVQEHTVRNHLRASKSILGRRLKRFKPLTPSGR